MRTVQCFSFAVSWEKTSLLRCYLNFTQTHIRLESKHGVFSLGNHAVILETSFFKPATMAAKAHI